MDDRRGQEGVVLVGRQDDGAVTVDLTALAEQRQDAVGGSEPSPAVCVHPLPLPLFV